MDAKKILINTGAATDSYCLSVLANYSRYKYSFRAMPTNLTSSAKEITKFYALALKPAMEAEYPGLNVTKVAIIREDLEWTYPMWNILNGYYRSVWRFNKTQYWYLEDYYGLNDNPWFNFTIVDEIAYPITATSTDFTAYLNQLDVAGAQVVFPIISGQTGITLMQQYSVLNPSYLIAGIDYFSQFGDYWENSSGDCNYEIVMQSTTRTNKTNLTLDMWDAYVEMWDKDPFYTGIGSYDSVFMLLDAINAAQSINSNDTVTQLETINKTNPMEGAGGNIAFTATHDLYEGYDPVTEIIYSVTLWKQWQSGGTQVVISSGDYIYPEWIVDGPIQIPPWGINS